MPNASGSLDGLWNEDFARELMARRAEVSEAIGREIGQFFHSRALKLGPAAAATRFVRVVAQAGVSVAEGHALLQRAWYDELGSVAIVEVGSESLDL